jgi:hypothetical protein
MEKLGEGAYQLLLERKNDISRGREARKTKGKGDIAKHYREEHKKMADLRQEIDAGRIEFTGYF